MHAIRNLARIGFGTVALARIGFGTVAVRWSQLGFGRTSTTSTSQSTPRNLFGFKDGTLNVKAEETADLDEHVWVGAGRRPGLAGRRLLPGRPADQHAHRDLGPAGAAAAGGGGRPDQGHRARRCPAAPSSPSSTWPMKGTRRAADPGRLPRPVVSPERNDGVRMLRRGYNFVDGSNALGGLDAGLFFIAYVRDPRTHFIPLQTRMASNDALMEYLQFTSSALFAVPPGRSRGSTSARPSSPDRRRVVR